VVKLAPGVVGGDLSRHVDSALMATTELDLADVDSDEPSAVVIGASLHGVAPRNVPVRIAGLVLNQVVEPESPFCQRRNVAVSQLNGRCDICLKKGYGLVISPVLDILTGRGDVDSEAERPVYEKR